MPGTYLSPSIMWSPQLLFNVCLPHRVNYGMDPWIQKQRNSSKIISVSSLGNWAHPGYSGQGESWGLLAEAPIMGAVEGYCSHGQPLGCSCSLNSERSRCTICQGAGGREPISIHCRQLFIWKSTSNVPIRIALLHFSTFMSVIAFIFLVKTAKQVIIYYITAHIGWVCSHNNFNPPSQGLVGKQGVVFSESSTAL